MSFDEQRLYELLPAIHRIRDSEQGGPLKELLTVIADQIAVLEENIEQLYDDQFIETCADWVVPYIGDLIGYRPLHAVADRINSPRAEVANTIAYRRRKGTATVLEQLARDVTDWPARVVEFFELLATTQFMNHLRPANHYAPDLRRWEPLERVNTAFDSLSHTADVRGIAGGRGKHNIPNIGIFLWRLKAYRASDAPAFQVDGLRYFFSPLGHDMPLFTRPEAEDEITHLAKPINVPELLSRRVLHEHLDDYYGEGKSLLLRVDGQIRNVTACNLSDVTPGGAWAHTSTDGEFLVDPVLGRISLPAAADSVEVTYHYGFSGDLGGGEYERLATFDAALADEPRRSVPGDRATIDEAVAALNNIDGVVEITDNQRYSLAMIELAEGQRLELRAANERRPKVDLTDTLTVSGETGSHLTLNGLLIVGGALEVSDDASLNRLTLRHCTLVPGRRLSSDGEPLDAGEASLIVAAAGVEVEIDRCIVGPVQLSDTSSVRITESIVDATDEERMAFSAPPIDLIEDPPRAGGKLFIDSSTVIGRIRTVEVELISNCILAARNAGDQPGAPIQSLRKQAGCVRFTSLPRDSVVPRRYRCQPDLGIQAALDKATEAKGNPLTNAEAARVAENAASRLRPVFTKVRYGQPAYGQLAQVCPAEIRTGAEDESEMGVFRHLHQPQREANLRARLAEYMRFGLEAGIFYET